MKIHSHISNFILFLVLLASTTSFLLGNTDVRIMQFEKIAYRLGFEAADKVIADYFKN